MSTSPPRTPASRLLGALLLRRGLLDEPDLESALVAQGETGERLGELLVRTGRVDPSQVAEALAEQLGLAWEPGPLDPAPEALALVPRGLALRRGVLPLALTARTVQVAMRDPLDLGTVDDLQFRTGRRVIPVVVPPSALEEGLSRGYPGGEDPSSPSAGSPALPSLAPSAEARREAEGEEGEDPGVIRRVDRLLEMALARGASDLHVEPSVRGLEVRARVDGILRALASLPASERRAVISRIKVLAGMDISVRRRPQDGGFPHSAGRSPTADRGKPGDGAAGGTGGRTLSVRVSTLPVEEGEKAVLRILDPERVPSGLEELGFGPSDLARLRALLRGGRGVVLASGPTGSGKSSTLFGALAEVDRERLNVLTLEDPVEYRVPGVSQVQVNPRAGLTFPAGLRAALRQDPDVIMVGEIRDRETAEIAMAAAVTGHLVLSSIHTTDAPGGITRLLQMGVPAHLVAGGLAGIVAQRLVRVRCPGCGGAERGCPECNDGYRGRTGVFEVLVMDEGLRDEVMQGSGTEVLRRRAREGGMGSMALDARRKVAEGLTTPHEVARVLHRDPGSRPPCAGCGGDVPGWALGCPSCGRAVESRCRCETRLQPGWRFCPGCMRPVSPTP